METITEKTFKNSHEYQNLVNYLSFHNLLDKKLNFNCCQNGIIGYRKMIDGLLISIHLRTQKTCWWEMSIKELLELEDITFFNYCNMGVNIQWSNGFND